MSSSSSSTSSYFCHSCGNIVRVSPTPALSCPSCGLGFVEEIISEPSLLVIGSEPSLLVIGSSFSPRDLHASGDAELPSAGSGRPSSSARGFLRRLFRSGRNSRPSENSPPFFQVLEVASMFQRSRDTESRNDRGDGFPPRGASIGFSWANDDGVSTGTEDDAGFQGVSREDRSLNPISGTSSDEVADPSIDRLHDNAFSQRPFDAFLQRILAGVLQNGRQGSLPASKAAIAAMPTFNISKQSLDSDSCGNFDEGVIECAVCKEAFEIGGEVKEMPCKHFYHSNCILPWLELHSSCPLCRHEMPVDAEEPASLSSRIDGGPGATAAREPMLVFVGISGGDALLFSFIFVGSGSRNEATITGNGEGEQSRLLPAGSEEELGEGEGEGEQGSETMDGNAASSSSEASGASALIDRGPTEITIEPITERTNSFGMRSEVLQSSTSGNDRNLENTAYVNQETESVQEVAGTRVSECRVGNSSRDETDSLRDSRLSTSAARDGQALGGRSRGIFSLFSRHGFPRHMFTSNNGELSVEGNALYEGPTVGRVDDADGKTGPSTPHATS